MAPLDRASRAARMLAALVLMALPVAVAAAGTDDAASRSNAGAEEKAFRGLGRVAPPPEKAKVTIERPSQEGLEIPNIPAGVSFSVKDFHVTGNTVLRKKELDDFFKNHRGKSYDIPGLGKVTEALTELYRGKGYATTRVLVPTQRIPDGVVTLQVVEGKVGKLLFQGNRFFSNELLQRRLTLREGDLLNLDALEMDLARLNANPDREAKVSLQAGKIPGSSDLLFDVKDHFPFHVGYEFSNLGTFYTGKLRQGVTFAHTNLSGRDDQLTGRVDISERGDFRGESFNYLLPLDGRGRMFTFDFSNVDIHLGKDLKGANVFGRATVYSPGFIQPLFSTRQWEGEFVAGFDMKRVRTSQLNRDDFVDNLRVIRFGPNLIERDAHGRSILINQVDAGLAGVLGGSRKYDASASRRRTGGQFFTYQLGLARLQNLWLQLQAIFRAQMQLSSTRLVPAQQMRMGGVETVRGYPEGDYLADYGFNFSQELRIPLYPVPEDWKIPFTQKTWRQCVQMAIFCDGARGFFSEAALEEDKNKFLLGIGGGIRANLDRNISFRADWAKPQGDQPIDGGRSSRFHFAMKLTF